jgi:hypothetical protein
VVLTYVSFRSMYRLAKTGTVKVIVLRVREEVDLVGAAAGCHWGS